MSIYLPIAEMNVNIFLIVFIGMVVGALSGLLNSSGIKSQRFYVFAEDDEVFNEPIEELSLTIVDPAVC